MCSLKFGDQDVFSSVYVRFEEIVVTLFSLFAKGKHTCFMMLEKGESLGTYVAVTALAARSWVPSKSACGYAAVPERGRALSCLWPQSLATAYLVLWGPQGATFLPLGRGKLAPQERTIYA